MPHHNVYVVLLDKRVWRVRRFAEKNPHYIFDKPCVYVGMTGRSPEVRLQQHHKGVHACSLVRNHGHSLMPELYEHLNPMPQDEAARKERALAVELRAQGYAVWQC